jgi:excisionase family DNA binding protein
MKLATVGEHISNALDGRPSCVLLTTALKTWRFQRGEFPSLVRALLANELAARRPANRFAGLGCVELFAEELKSWLINVRRASCAWLSVDEAAKQLGLKQQVAYELVARGLIASSMHERGRRVAPEAVESFRCTYVALSELAAEQSMAPRRVLTLLTSRPVCGPCVDGARQYFYRRDDIDLSIGALPKRDCRNERCNKAIVAHEQGFKNGDAFEPARDPETITSGHMEPSNR